MPAVITLVHGTWGQQSDWVKEHSPLRATFETALKDLVFFRTFFWSGSNSFAARGTAAEDLKSFLREGLELFPSKERGWDGRTNKKQAKSTRSTCCWSCGSDNSVDNHRPVFVGALAET